MICPKCGFDNLQESTFCTECGFEFLKRESKKKTTPYPNPSPPLALFLSILIPGAGQAYNKEYKKAGNFFIFIWLFLLLSIYFFGTFPHIIFISIFSILEMFMLADAYFSAYRIRDTMIDSRHRKKIYTRIGIGLTVVFLICLAILNTLFSTYDSSFDISVLEIMKNDRIFIKKNYYNLHSPQVGDLVSIDLILGKITDVNLDEVKLRGIGGRIYDARYRQYYEQRPTRNGQFMEFAQDGDRGALWNNGQPVVRDISVPMELFRKIAGKLMYIYAPIERRKKL